ncbi:hypothetical protein LCGC14_0769090 [marine sediment metagenome]|uniref:NAD-dependent epimerase/dehydratase domain-containing protein n=1 Tax=marine sediment metagenome TaxID=412755 RepID=A0A0F9Q332_9ZZZZ
MKTACVTGSQGFIGSYICQELLSCGYKVVGIDNFSKYGQVARLHDNHPNFTLFTHDIIDIQSLSLQHYQFDYVIACAAMIGGIQYFHKFAYDLLATNERILAATFDWAIELFKHNHLNRIVMLSSSMVFECTSVYPTPEEERFHCPPPLSTYGFQKLASEYFCKGAFEQYGLPFTIIRPFNCIGVGEGEATNANQVSHGNVRMLMSHVVPDLIYKSLTIKPSDKLPILGSGKQIRHYTHGRDIAEAVKIAMESPEAINEDFNVSSDRPISVEELATMIWKMIHGDVLCRLEHLEPFEYDVQIRSPDVSKMRERLGFECKRDVEQSLPEIIEWIRKYYNI